jgi:Domain of unknown function (DUF4381)
MSAPLDKLHDFYQPPPPAWAPQTIGWYVVFAIVGIGILWLAAYSFRRWLSNRYRREALRELAPLPPQQFSSLLKRTALTVWPRDKVASLSGETWLSFLNVTAAGDLFQRAPGISIEELALRSDTVSRADEDELRKIAAEWIRRHRVQA